MTASNQEDLAPEEDEDYYSLLNIPRDAPQSSINDAYRRLSRLYHPDKHVVAEQKQRAEVMFGKIKTAYEVLSDPHRRAIYDSVGVAGLRTEGWQVVQRTKTPQEIRDEYEQLAREQAERRLLQRTNPKGSVTLFINATDLFCSYGDELDDDELDDWLLPQVEVTGMSFTQSIEAPLTLRDTATMSGNLSTSNGTGQGQVSCSVRRLFSDRCWAEAELGVGDGLMVSTRAFRSLGRHLHATGHGFIYLLPNGLGRVGLLGSLGCQLDRRTVGYLSYRVGRPAGVQAMVVRETEHSRQSVSLYVGVPHSYVTGSLTVTLPEADVKARLVAKGGSFGFLVECGLDKKITELSTLGATVSVGLPTGVAVKLRLSRASQTYTSHVRLSDELQASAVFYGTVVPLLAWTAVNRLLVAPYVSRRQKEEAQRRREANRERTAAKRREAEAAVSLMRETVARIRQAEELRRGLVITAAWYGRIVQAGSGDQANGGMEDLVDVTIPLQCLVTDSKLILQEGTKSHLPGFFDPAPDTEKSLQVEYLFHNARHQVTVADTDPLRIPKPSHRTES
ncbi:dnaJ homolog subfamily C member 11-like [Amphibalanus amphitrite]|uniref:dnaJ homolog subfamily C member 11-like n=1 Tax=Amphibalanus amphitrite TaxID=1232801 RepID=UPI001C91BF53|nr:dnaJ homolog subfamily C member 11-like [Amphibalanus amphitrite]XP_043213364.1 dnaJ homolog subfamily C member 11-like [Amphibalanus amphitrite]XP_043213365.1 dnaJ homolog subfamily C member 11-like [Amphibalanus amphitrite]XP_043213366.1 dnaJ homolog subfamily C member 11-like [Amphibalanus amphitrite]XP_043213367.1 dnaJ homolog subfamily C member 11-like [Amphibalanus amphitrite]XP_043213369.1 dnaJ homolog subfamily C member 11-like [Amphibalanus amphitrite]